MASHPSPPRWTYAEFARLPEDGNRYEVIAGELCVTPAPRPRHQRVVTDLVIALGNHVRRHELEQVYAGPIGVPEYWVVDPDAGEILVQPDLLRVPLTMTELLKKAFEEASKLAPREQDAFAAESMDCGGGARDV